MNKQIEKSLAKIAKHEAIIHQIQEACEHPNLATESKWEISHFTNNYSAWTENDCPDCGKHWVGDQ